jgi:hypothetical protein
MLRLIPHKEAEMAIIRRADGRRHEVDFGDAPVRVEIYANEETVDIFIEADFDTLRRNVGASPFSTFRATCSAKLPPRRRDVPQDPAPHPGVASDFATRAVNLWHDPVTAASRGALVYARRRPARQNTPVPFPNGTPESMERSVARSAPRGLASPGPPSVADDRCGHARWVGKRGVPNP